MNLLKLLEQQAKSCLDDGFFNGAINSVDVAPYVLVREGSRQIDVTPLCEVTREAMTRELDAPDKSDSWLAPRVHACLRLTRREAADRRIWSYLAVVLLPDYVRWRFPGSQGTPADRFFGPEYKNAIARLWWGAELTRNGSSYEWTVEAFQNQRISDFWQSLDVFHHRPAALAIVRFLKQLSNGQKASTQQTTRLGQALNMTLKTQVLDSISENELTNPEVLRQWCAEEPDVASMLHSLPPGPDEPPVSPAAVDAVSQLLDGLAAEIDLIHVKEIRRRRSRVPLGPAETPRPVLN